MTSLTAERLRSLLDYNQETGVFTWRERVTRSARPGEPAGHVDAKTGYMKICVGMVRTKAHRLAWFYVHGRWPSEHIDHIDGDKLNNAIANLREASTSENMRNRGKLSTNTSGFKGVSLDKNLQKWRAQITADGKKISLGYYSSPEEAASAYANAACRFHGEFARPD